jgi:hypothetical protein
MLPVHVGEDVTQWPLHLTQMEHVSNYRLQ